MEEAWSARDVYLLTEGADGQVAVPHLTLTFRASGVALGTPDGEVVWDGPWGQLDEMSPVERSVLPDGRDGVVIAVVERGLGRPHRFVLATDDAAVTEASFRDIAAAHGLRTTRPRPAVSRLLTASIVVAALATVTVLLLSAVHVIHL
jgi:hypothetical protein